MLIWQSIPWIEVGRTWGVLGIIFILVSVGLWKGLPRLLTYFKDQQAEAHATLLATIEDARKERDYMREQRALEVSKFVESLRFRDERFKEVADALDRIGRRR